jgi:putative ABC transport system permease protein
MMQQNLRSAFRFIKRNLAFSLINILGLSMGIALVTISWLWIEFEFSFDKFHENADRIFRVVVQFNENDIPDDFANTPAPLGEALKNDIPEVLEYVRFGGLGRTLVTSEKGQFWEEIDLADPTIFKVFSFTLLSGDPQTALQNTNSLVISETKARKYFGNSNPLGQILRLDSEKIPYTITGVMKDIPANSQISFDFLSSFANMKSNLNWYNWNYITYILSQTDQSYTKIMNELPEIGRKYIKDDGTRLNLQRLTSIHLHSNLRNDLETNRNIKIIYIFVSICILVLIVACINYMNMATARYTRRGKEVGLRKVAGATHSDLRIQFLFESFATTVTAFFIALIICYLLLPVFHSLSGVPVRLGTLVHVKSIVLLIVLVLLVSFVSGSYPAFVLSALNPVSALHDDFSLVNTLSVRGLRKVLVVFQFIVAIILIACTVIIQSQLNFIRNKNLGLSPDQVVVVPVFQDDVKRRYDIYKHEILGNPLVLNVSALGYFPGALGYRQNVWWEGLPEGDKTNTMDFLPVDQDFINTLKISMLQGDFFSDPISGEVPVKYVLNELAVKKAGWNDPIGKQFDIVGKGEVIGVVSDFNFKSLHNKLGPAALVYFPEVFDNLMIRISTENIPKTIGYLTRKWESLFPQYPFEFTFLSDDFQKMYEKEMKTSRIIMYVSFMALFIACIGLFGLVLFTVDRRVREIGLRKVAGASSGSIILLFNLEFIRRILVSFVISCPVVLYFMQKWLEDFAYRTKISWWMFALAGIIPLGTSVILVCWLTWYSSTRNPADCLRHE